MTTKYEIIEIDSVEVTVDVSLFIKSEAISINATQIAKSFGKEDVREFLRSTSTVEYIDVILNEGNPHIKDRDDLVVSKRGKYGGTWLHRELALEFAGWCSAVLRREMHKWLEAKLEEE